MSPPLVHASPSRLRRRALRVSFAAALAVLFAQTAEAQQTQSVTLRDGTTVTGEIVEYLLDDHVTLRLSTGATRRVAWSELASPVAPPAVGAPATPPLPLPPPAPPPAPAPPPPLVAPPAPVDEPQTATPSGSIPYELRPEHGVDSDTAWLLRPPAIGIQTGYGAPEGDLALVLENRMLGGWVVVQALLGTPVADTPWSFGANLLLDGRFGNFGFGGGVGIADSFTKTIVPGSHPAPVTFLVTDVSHFSWYVTRQLAARASLGMTVPLNDRTYCVAHAGACPEPVGADSAPLSLSGTLTVLFAFDFGHD
jgi:hypothetical protein